MNMEKEIKELKTQVAKLEAHVSTFMLRLQGLEGLEAQLKAVLAQQKEKLAAKRKVDESRIIMPGGGFNA